MKLRSTKIEGEEVSQVLTVGDFRIPLDSTLSDYEFKMYVVLCHAGSIKQKDLFAFLGKGERQGSRILDSLVDKCLAEKAKMGGNINVISPLFLGSLEG